MERLTLRYDGVPIFKAGRESNIIARLCDIEDILGDDYDLARLRELVTADKEGRCVVLPWLRLRRKENGMAEYIRPALAADMRR